MPKSRLEMVRMIEGELYKPCWVINYALQFCAIATIIGGVYTVYLGLQQESLGDTMDFIIFGLGVTLGALTLWAYLFLYEIGLFWRKCKSPGIPLPAYQRLRQQG